MAAALKGAQHQVSLCPLAKTDIHSSCSPLRLDAVPTTRGAGILTRSISCKRQHSEPRTASSFSSGCCSSSLTNLTNFCDRSGETLQLPRSFSSFHQFASGSGLQRAEKQKCPSRRPCVAMAGGADNAAKPRRVLFVCLDEASRLPLY